MNRRGSARRGSARRGSALLATLATIAVLATLTALVSQGARTSAAVATNARADAVARAMAESGVLAAVSQVEAALAARGDEAARQAAFDALFATALAADGAPAPFVADTLGDGGFAVALVNVSARFDVNSADVDGLTTLFSHVAPIADAAAAAQRIADRVRQRGREPDARRARDSITAALLGREVLPEGAGRFESLDEVSALLGDGAPWLARAAAWLTVDGDGRVDRRHAPAEVRRAAAGALVDAPTRLLLVSRGWQSGALLTREIQAVYAVNGARLQLVRWREQTR